MNQYMIHRAVKIGSLDEQDRKYGVPSQKKFPMPDADHVRSAIKFFNYVDPKHEKELASAIIKRMKEYGLSFSDISVGDANRFSKYVPSDELAHHGILGQKWGIRRYQNKDGSLTPAGEKRYSRGEKKAIGVIDAEVKLNSWDGKSHDELERSVNKWNKAAKDFRNAFPDLKKMLKEANNIMYEADQYEGKERRKAKRRVEEIANDYSERVEKIFQPFKESIPNYDLFTEWMSEDFFDNVYGFDDDGYDYYGMRGQQWRVKR